MLSPCDGGLGVVSARCELSRNDVSVACLRRIHADQSSLV